MTEVAATVHAEIISVTENSQDSLEGAKMCSTQIANALECNSYILGGETYVLNVGNYSFCGSAAVKLFSNLYIAPDLPPTLSPRTVLRIHLHDAQLATFCFVAVPMQDDKPVVDESTHYVIVYNHDNKRVEFVLYSNVQIAPSTCQIELDTLELMSTLESFICTPVFIEYGSIAANNEAADVSGQEADDVVPDAPLKRSTRTRKPKQVLHQSPAPKLQLCKKRKNSSKRSPKQSLCKSAAITAAAKQQSNPSSEPFEHNQIVNLLQQLTAQQQQQSELLGKLLLSSQSLSRDPSLPTSTTQLQIGPNSGCSAPIVPLLHSMPLPLAPQQNMCPVFSPQQFFAANPYLSSNAESEVVKAMKYMCMMQLWNSVK